jgi:hypothetical protein
MAAYLSAGFQDKRAAVRAIEELKARGASNSDLDVFSTEPVVFEPGVLDRPTHMSLAVVIAALLFGVSAAWFIYYTQYNYPLVTGGMPIFSFWSVGVPIYELTMFGAIVTTFAWFLGESKLFRRERAPVPALEPGVISLRVRCEPDESALFEKCLEEAGAESVTRLRGRA